MQIETVYKVCGKYFNTKEEAEKFEKEIQNYIDFNIGDEVYLNSENELGKIVKSKIIDIEIFYRCDGSPYPKYIVKNMGEFYRDELFKTFEDVCTSLKEKMIVY